MGSYLYLGTSFKSPTFPYLDKSPSPREPLLVPLGPNPFPQPLVLGNALSPHQPASGRNISRAQLTLEPRGPGS